MTQDAGGGAKRVKLGAEAGAGAEQDGTGAEQGAGVLSVSINWCYPYTDFQDMGNTAIVVVDLDLTPLMRAEQLATGLMADIFLARSRVPVFPSTLPDAVEAGRLMAGPVLLLDTADCAGGGAAGDSPQLVRQLLDYGAGAVAEEQCIAMVVDPAAAALCLAAFNKGGAGATVTLELGHTLDSAAARRGAGLPAWGEPLCCAGKVARAKNNVTFEYVVEAPRHIW